MESKPSSELKDYEILIADNYVLDATKKIDSDVYSGRILKKIFQLQLNLNYKDKIIHY